MQDDRSDFLIIGSGIAGVRAALELSVAGRVLLLTKSRTGESNTEYAQGGIAAALDAEDDVEDHIRDTERAGDGICDPLAVRVLVEEGPERVLELIEWGAAFDRSNGDLTFTREAAHSRNRILHAHGDATGQEINRVLINRARGMKAIRLQPHSFALDLLVGESGCEGVRYLEQSTGSIREVRADRVLLATGGLGAAFRDTTNPGVATGDGFALALRAGAVLADMEFVQFHPTALKLAGAPRFLLSEALRGEGAYLRNGAGERFMRGYHSLAELAPRDTVARAIVSECQREGVPAAFLDLRHLDAEFVTRRFPTILRTCRRFGLDLTKDLLPVFPATHYMMGGIATDLWGRTSIPRLFAAGEVACNGAHGANRLASNSLLDGLVFGARSGQAMLQDPAAFEIRGEEAETLDASHQGNPEQTSRRQLREVLTSSLGILRSGEELQRALTFLAARQSGDAPSARSHEDENIRLVGIAIAGAALVRQESRGGHFRADFPQKNDRDWRCHTLQTLSPRTQRLTIQKRKRLQDAASAL